MTYTSDITVDESVNTTLSIFDSINGGTSKNTWNLSGNEVTSDNFIGTTNDAPLVLKVNNQIAGKVLVY